MLALQSEWANPSQPIIDFYVLLVNFICRIREFGNPVNYAGWVDESLNMTLRTAARRAHRRTMEIRVFSSFAMQGRMHLRVELFGSD